MAISREILPITEDDAFIEKALKDAHLPALLPALAQVLGDLSILRDDLHPDTSMEMRQLGGYLPDAAVKARAVAFDAIRRYRDGGCKAAPPPGDDQLRQMLAFLSGGELTEDYIPLLLEELAYPARDARAPKWTKDELAHGRQLSVAVIGAGMSGLLAAHRLKQAGIPVTILEKNGEVGGTWWENTYPGARVDNSNHMYSYSFAQRVDWPYYFSTQDVLLDYFKSCADEFGLRPHIRFNTEVTSATWDEDRGTWVIRVKTPSGEDTVEAQALISAVGQLNRPKMPDIKGINSFEGPSFHSARWDHSVDLNGKVVAVIGSGASASQLIPEVAKEAKLLKVFQRTPNYYVPVPNYHDAVPEGMQWLFLHIPGYAQWYRFWLFWTSAEGLLQMAEVAPEWQPGQPSLGPKNDELKLMLSAYLQGSFADKPDLLEKVLPQYPPASKRMVLDNGVWIEALKRENVELVTDAIEEVTPRGVRTKDGTEHEVDVIVYATGFQASKFLTPMKVTGRDGRDLHETWDGDARAYMGITLPHFPNFFMLYGPNTNIVVNGSIVYFSECEVQYVMACLRMLLESGSKSLDCKEEVHDAYNERIDAGNLRMAWGVAEVPSWYRNDKGRSAQNWPFSLLEYWQQTREVDPADYVVA